MVRHASACYLFNPSSLFLLIIFTFAFTSATYIRTSSSIRSYQTLSSFFNKNPNDTTSTSPHSLFGNWFNPQSIIGGVPRTREAPTPSEKGFSDQSAYVGLGTSAGAVIAIADFNRDRFLDVLTLHSSSLRRLSVMLWDHDAYAFKHVAHDSLIDLDGPAVRAAEKAFNPNTKPLGRIKQVIVADYGNDGIVDVLVTDGQQGRVFFGDGTGGFGPRDQRNASAPFAPVVIPELSPVTAILDADADSVPDILTVFRNGTRGFWQLQLESMKSVRKESSQGETVPDIVSRVANDSRFLGNKAESGDGADSENDENDEDDYNLGIQRHVAVFKPWPGGLNLGSDGKPCRTEDDMAPSIAFADMDGDCLADLVIPTTCGIEIWSNPGPNGAFWELSAAHSAGQMRLLDTQVYNYAHGDRAIKISDFDSDGTNDLAIVNRNRHDLVIHRNIQVPRGVGELCEGDDNWTLQKVVGVVSGVNLKKPRIGPIIGAIDVPPMLHVGDYDQDGLSDFLIIDGGSSQPLLLRNKGIWAHGRPDETHFEAVKDTKSGGLGRVGGGGSAISAAFFDTDESGRQDILLVKNGNESKLIWNAVNDRWDALFFKGTMLSGLSYRSAEHRQAPKPFAPVVGNTIKLSYMQRGSRGVRVRRVCSQCSQSAGLFQLSICNCQYGLHGIANYVEELWAGAAGKTRGWTGLMPNSMAVIWGDANGNSAAWWMEYFTQRRGSQMLRVTAILMAGLVVLAVLILYLQQREAKEDRERDERESMRLFNFVV